MSRSQIIDNGEWNLLADACVERQESGDQPGRWQYEKYNNKHDTREVHCLLFMALPLVVWPSHKELVDIGTRLGDITRTTPDVYLVEQSKQGDIEHKDENFVLMPGKTYVIVSNPKLKKVVNELEVLHEKVTRLERRVGNTKSPKRHVLAKSLTVSDIQRPPLKNEPIVPLSTRTMTVTELIKGEEIYLENLNILEEIFHYNLTHMAKDPLYKEEGYGPSIKMIFAGLTTIKSTSGELLRNLQTELQKRPDDPYVGHAFVSILAYFKVYTSYISGYDDRIAELKNLKQNERFNEFLTKLEASNQKRLNKRTLNDILIHPVKRMPQYFILLQRLIKHTPNDHADYENLVKAELSCRNMTEHFEEQSQHAASAKEVIRVMNSIHIGKKFAELKRSSPHRIFLFGDRVKASFSKGSGKSLRISSYIVHAFNDCVLFSTKSKMKIWADDVTLKYYFWIKDISKIEQTKENHIEMVCGTQAILISATTEKTLKEWLMYITTHQAKISEQSNQRRKLKPRISRTTSQKMEKCSDDISRASFLDIEQSSDVVMRMSSSGNDLKVPNLRKSSSANDLSSFNK